MAFYSYTPETKDKNDWAEVLYYVDYALSYDDLLDYYADIHLTVPKKVHFDSLRKAHVTFVRYIESVQGKRIEIKTHWYLNATKAGAYTAEFIGIKENRLKGEGGIVEKIIKDALSLNMLVTPPKVKNEGFNFSYSSYQKSYTG